MVNAAPLTPKYWMIAEELRAQIQSGELRPGDRMLSRVEMQERHKISCATLNKVHQILEGEGLIYREQGRGTFVAEPRPPIKTSNVAVVGFNLEETEGAYYWMNLLRGAQRAAHRNGLDKMVPRDNDAIGWEKFDGLLLHAGRFSVIHERPFSMPVVCILFDYPGVQCVLADEADGTRKAVGHLLKIGHRRIGYMAWFDWLATVPRLRGYRAALGHESIYPEPELLRAMRYIPEDPDNELGQFHNGYANMRLWLKQGFLETECTALLVHNDVHALGVVKALREAGLDVPRDISIVGFDGTEEAARTSPSLTTIVVPYEQISETAMELLASRVRGESVSDEPVVFPTHLRVGESTAPPHR